MVRARGEGPRARWSAEAGAGEVEAATAVLRRFSDQRLTLTDALGLHVMSARRIQTCWSTDRHLGLTGVPLLIG